MATKKTKEKEKSTNKLEAFPIIKGARLTEKSALFADKGAYTFNVLPSANKIEIKKAIKKIYNVTPVKISILKMKPKNVFIRGKKGVKQGGKKAVVYLKEGDKIEFV